MAVKEQERTPATGEQDHVVLSGDENEGRNTATGLVTLTEDYRVHPNLRLTRADSGFTPYNIFFSPALYLSPCCFKFIFLCGWRAFVISFSQGLAFLLLFATTYFHFCFRFNVS